MTNEVLTHKEGKKLEELIYIHPFFYSEGNIVVGLIPVEKPKLIILPHGEDIKDYISREASIPEDANAYCVSEDIDGSKTRGLDLKLPPVKFYTVQYYILEK